MKFRPPDGPASKASAMPNVVRQRVVCFAPLRMVAGEPYKNTEIVSIQKKSPLLFSWSLSAGTFDALVSGHPRGNRERSGLR